MSLPNKYQVNMTRKMWKDLYLAVDEAKSLQRVYSGEDRLEFMEMIRNAEKALEALRPQKA